MLLISLMGWRHGTSEDSGSQPGFPRTGTSSLKTKKSQTHEEGRRTPSPHASSHFTIPSCIPLTFHFACLAYYWKHHVNRKIALFVLLLPAWRTVFRKTYGHSSHTTTSGTILQSIHPHGLTPRQEFTTSLPASWMICDTSSTPSLHAFQHHIRRFRLLVVCLWERLCYACSPTDILRQACLFIS